MVGLSTIVNLALFNAYGWPGFLLGLAMEAPAVAGVTILADRRWPRG
jgi:hypothetical protein